MHRLVSWPENWLQLPSLPLASRLEFDGATLHEIEYRENLLKTPNPDQDKPDQTNEINIVNFIDYMKGKKNKVMSQLDLSLDSLLKEVEVSNDGGI